MKKNSLITIAVAAFAAAFLVASGCSGKREAKAYAPLAPNGTLIGIVMDYKAVAESKMYEYEIDFTASKMKEMAEFVVGHGLSQDAVELSDEDIASFKAEAKETLEKIDWCAVTVAKPAFTSAAFGLNNAIPFPDTTLTYAFKEPVTLADVDKKLVDKMRAEIEKAAAKDGNEELGEILKWCDDNISVSTATISGCPAKKISFVENDDTRALLESVRDFAPCYGVYGGRLVIFASSPKAFGAIVNLYEGAAQPSSHPMLAADFSPEASGYFRMGVYGIAQFIKEFLAEDELADLPEEARRYVDSLDYLKISSSMDDQAMAQNVVIDVALGDEELASSMSTAVEAGKGMLAFGVGAAAYQVPALAPATKMVNSLQISSEGGVCKIAMAVTKDMLEALDMPAMMEQLAARGAFTCDDEDDGSDDFADDEDDLDDDEEASADEEDEGDDVPSEDGDEE